MAIDFGVKISPTDILNLGLIERALDKLGIGMSKVTKYSANLDGELGLLTENLEVLARDIAGIPTDTVFKIRVDFDPKDAEYKITQIDRVVKNKTEKVNLRPESIGIKNLAQSFTKTPLSALSPSLFTMTQKLEARITKISDNISNMFDSMSISATDASSVIKDVMANGLSNFDAYSAEQKRIAQETMKLNNIVANELDKARKATDKKVEKTKREQNKKAGQELRNTEATIVEDTLRGALKSFIPVGITAEETAKKIKQIDAVVLSTGNQIRRGTATVDDFKIALVSLASGVKPTDDLNKATASLIEMFDRGKIRAEAFTASQKKNVKEMDQRVRDARTSRLGVGIEKRLTGMLPTDLNPEELTKRQLIIKQTTKDLLTTFRSGKMSITELTSSWSSFISGIRLANMTGPMERFILIAERARQRLTKMSEASKKASKESQQAARDADATRALNVVQSSLTKMIDPSLSPEEQTKRADRIRKSANSIVNDLRTGKITVAEFYKTFAAARTGAPLIGATSKEVRKLYDNVLNLKNVASGPPGGGGKGSAGILGWLVTPAGLSALTVVQAAHRVVGSLITQITKHFDSAVEFERTVARIMTITSGAKFMSKDTWTKELIQISKNTGVAAVEVAKAANEVYSTNLGKGKEALTLLEQALEFAQISGASGSEAINLLTYTINSFKMSTEDANNILAVYYKTIDIGNVKAADLSTTIGTIAPLAKQAGVEFLDVAAALATLTNQGISTEQSSTLLRNVIKEMISPTKELKELFAEWGVQTGDQALKVYGFQGVLAKLNKEMREKGTTRIAELVDDLRSLQAVPALAGDKNLDAFKQTREELRKGVEDYAEAKKIMADSNALNLDKLLAGMSGTAISIINKFLEGVSGLQTSKSFEVIRESIEKIGDSLFKLGDVTVKTFETLDDFFVLLEKTIGEKNVQKILKYAPNAIHASLVVPLQTAATVLEHIKELIQWLNGENKDGLGAQQFEVNKETRSKLLKDLDDLRTEFSKTVEGRGAVTSKILDKLKGISGIEKDSIEKLMEKQKENMDKLKEKSNEVVQAIRNDFAERLLSNKLQGETIFDRLEKSKPVIADLVRESQQLFAGRNIDEARKKFESIQKIVERINDDLKTSINDSVKKIRDIQVKAEEEKFQNMLRKKSPGAKARLVAGRIEELIASAFNTADIEEARKLLENAENLAKEAHDPKKKSKADALVARVREAQIAREQQNIMFAQQAMQDELAIAQQRVALEEANLAQETAIDDLLTAQLKQHQAILDVTSKEIELFSKKIELLEKQINLTNNLMSGRTPSDKAKQDILDLQEVIFRNGGGNLINPNLPLGRAVGGFGIDNRLMRVSPNEMIINPRASRRWTSTLAAINAGYAPRGTNNNVSVGDININYTGTNSIETDVRKLAQEIRREIRRGTVRLT